jgi:hypothetical protein
MKNPKSMTKSELVEYTHHLKSMIAQLQGVIRMMGEDRELIESLPTIPNKLEILHL